MMLADAIVQPLTRTAPAGCAWFGHIVPGMSVGDLVEAVAKQSGPDGDDVQPDGVLTELLALEASGCVTITLQPETEALRAFYAGGHAGRIVTITDPSFAYVSTYERNWREHATLYDFVESDDGNGRLKSLERDIYLHHIGPYLDDLQASARVLDAGCGVGRLSSVLAARGYRLSCVDTSAAALKRAAQHIARAGGRAADVQIHLCDVRCMRMFGDGAFDAALALEVICYQDDPAESLAEIVRVTAPGGLIVLSVEGTHGSLIADGKIAAEHVMGVLDRRRLDVPEEISVRYFSEADLRSMVDDAGLECLEIVGTHYVPDGVLGRLLDPETLDDPEVRQQALALERRCAADPVLRPLARAWLTICRKGSMA